METVMITGGTGYVGAWVTRFALEQGYTVRLMVRDSNKTHKFSFLQKIAEKSPGNLEIWQANLLRLDSYNEAAKGCDLIFHLASPFTLRFKNAQEEIIDPAVQGTINVLNAASQSNSVKKVVLTSSVAAICGDNSDMKDLGLEEFDESHFNTSSSANHQPYSYSKVLAEKTAWELNEHQNKWKLVVVNPGFVMGPSLTKDSNSESIQIMKDLLGGKFMIGAPKLHFGFVDVRDVAQAHLLAAQTNDLNGRCIVVNQNMNMIELAQIVKKYARKKYLLPLFAAPKWLLKLLAPAFGVTPKFIENNVNHPVRFNNSKSKSILKLTYTDFDKTIEDMVYSL